MTLAAFASYLLTGLSGASSLFLVAAGLSLIFGVTRVVNFAHGSFFMLGLYLAVTLVGVFGKTPLGFWGAVVCASLAVGAIGVVVERLILRHLYAAPELLQLPHHNHFSQTQALNTGDDSLAGPVADFVRCHA